MDEQLIEQLRHALPRLVREHPEIAAEIQIRLRDAFASKDDLRAVIEAMDRRFEEARVESDRRFGEMRAEMNARFEAMDKRFEAMDKRFEAMDRRFEAMDKRFEAMVAAIRDLRVQVAGLSDTIGFGLEDIAKVVLPGYLERHLGVHVDDLDRRFFETGGKEPLEVDLYGEGKRDGDSVAVVVEVKARIHRDEAARFLRKLKVLKPLLEHKVVPVLFGYLVHPRAAELAAPRGVALVSSYQR
jgi:hypothetical protein